LDDAGVDTVLGKSTCKMVQGALVLMRGVRCGTLYKLLGSSYTNGCNIFVVPEQRNKEDKANIVPGKKTMMWHQRLGHIGEKGLQTLHGKGMIEGMSNYWARDMTDFMTLIRSFCQMCICVFMF
jgi:hypothetical protein